MFAGRTQRQRRLTLARCAFVAACTVVVITAFFYVPSYREQRVVDTHAQRLAATVHLSRLGVNPAGVKWKHKAAPRLNNNPFSAAWDNSIAGCAIARREATSDVREWLQHHRSIGIDHIFLFDNSEDGGKQSELMRDFIEDGFLTWIVLDGLAKQIGSFQYCADHFAHSYSWMLQFDMDEFIVVTDESIKDDPKPLKSLMQSFRFYPGLWIQWRVFGPGEVQHRPAVGGPLMHYKKCILHRPVNMYGKSLANMFWFKSVSNAHADYYRGDGMHVTDVLEPLPQVFDESNQQFIRASPRMPKLLEQKRDRRRGSRAVLHHYATRSYDDYQVKLQRGTPDKLSRASFRKQEWFDGIVRDEEFQPQCQVGVALGEKCCYRDGQVWPPVPKQTGVLPNVIVLPEKEVVSRVSQRDESPTVLRKLEAHPMSESWQPNVTICAALYPEVDLHALRDWVLHHKRIGVSRVELFAVGYGDVDPVAPKTVQESLDDVGEDLVAVKSFFVQDRASAPGAVNQKCIELFGKQVSWIAFLRVEDYLVPRGLDGGHLPILLAGTVFRYSPGVVVPVFQFYQDERAASMLTAAQSPLQTFDSCQYTGDKLVRTIGNTYWLDGSKGLESFHYRGDLLPVTDVEQKYIPAARDWFPTLKQPLPWDKMPRSMRKYLPSPKSFGTRLAVFSFLKEGEGVAKSPLDLSPPEVCAEAKTLWEACCSKVGHPILMHS